jgi:hypothetical protein
MELGKARPKPKSERDEGLPEAKSAHAVPAPHEARFTPGDQVVSLWR